MLLMGIWERQFKRTEEVLYNSIWKNLVVVQAAQNATASPNVRKRGHGKSQSKSLVVPLIGKSSWLGGVQLCLWDNICGPKIERVWQGTENITESLMLYIARHTLCGEIAQSSDSQIFAPETRFHVFSELGFVVTATLFMAPYYGVMTKFCLAIFTRKSNIDRYLAIHHFVEDRMFQLVCKLRVLYGLSSSTATESFEAFLPCFTSYTETLFCADLDSVQLASTPLGFDARNFTDRAAFERELDFLAKAITSHLQTPGSTIFVGGDDERINRYIDCMSFFLTAKEKALSVRVIDDFVPDLILQGIKGNANQIPDEAVIQSLMPSTLIDVDERTVKATYPYNVYTILRREYLLADIFKITMGMGNEKSWLQDKLFSSTPQAAPCVRQILEELFDLPVALREGFLFHSMRMLTRKAILLIK